MVNIKCSYCSNVVVDCGIKCSQCQDFDLCLQCFACSVEIGSHKKCHNYQVLCIQPTETEIVGSCELFTDAGWTLSEEDLLLDAVEHHGFGNWQEVADFVKTKTVDDCEAHFTKYFIDGNIGEATFPTEIPLKCVDETEPTRPDCGVKDLTIPEQQELGYMPLRDDLEREYDNEAETLISDVSLHYTDTPIDIAFKLFQVDTYRQRLRERLRRKEIAKQFGVMRNSTSFGWRLYRTLLKKRPREEKEFHDRHRTFGKFITQSEYMKLFYNLRRQQKLQKHILTLIKFNAQGHKTLNGKLKMHALQMNGLVNGQKKRRRKPHRFYR